MPFIQTADRVSLFVTEWGSGPPVVFTHAWGLRSDEWAYQVPALADAGHRCVACTPGDHDRLNSDILAFIAGDFEAAERH